MEIFLRLYISYYYHSIYSLITPYNKYPVNYETNISIRIKSSKFIIHSISNLTKYLIASKFKQTVYNNYQSLI